MRTWCLMPNECASLHAALRGAERVTGTRPRVAVVRRDDGLGGSELFTQVTLEYDVHSRELCDPPIVEVPIWETRGMPLEVQMIAAVQAWLFFVEQHLEAQAS